MKILRVIPSMDPKKGGPSEGIRQIQNEIEKQQLNIECDIVCMDDENNISPANSNLKIFNVGEGQGGYSYSRKLKNWLTQNVRKYDLVIIHGVWQYHSVVTSSVCLNEKVPYLLYSHGMLDPWFKKAYPLKHVKKMIYWMLFEKRVINKARSVVFTCEEEKILARKSFPFYTPNESVTAYGTAGSTFERSSAVEAFYVNFPELRNKKLILFVGRIHQKKGCDILLNAFAKIKERAQGYHVFFAGPDDSEYAKSLKVETKQLGLQDVVTWGGMLQGEKKWGAYFASKVFALPSHQENFGIVVAEALSASLPVLISNKVNIWREIEAEHSGLIADDNVESFSKIVLDFIERSDEEQELMRTNAKRCFDNKFEISKVAKSFEKIINERVING
ncbi:glycosyltransferase involved in cell wall biosynthesis [Raoultella sp. BIGb0399]|uniref:glycosyltransferase n=1 Tax=Raoultella sp. BIGb0399 TaxID=2485119 RepID=UPI000F4C5502|nr:glycosyltransferase [Raoultella sp. BIGb0399]ROS16564.1 glycosyltransferase involved in cell wall biosynthesis [Raoultella sp. BIGb0399]